MIDTNERTSTMSTENQIAANRANAQLSTGPTTAAGKAKAATNGLTHGLNSTPETLFAARPQEAEAFRALSQKLRRDCVPESDLEDAAFTRFAWANFQLTRARLWEELAEDRWLSSPDDAKSFSHLERTLKMAAALERRADQTMRELRQLQKDRIAAYEVYAEHCVMGKEVNIPKSLPTAELRRTDLARTSPNYLAQFLLYQTKEVKDTAKRMLKEAKIKANSPDEQSKANFGDNPFANLSIEELLRLAKQTGLDK